MPWTRYVYREFRMVGKNPFLSDFLGPYHPLMFSIFPEPDFLIRPRSKTGRQPPPGDYAQLGVYFKDVPVLMLDINAPGDLRNSLKRQEAIEKLQQRIKVLRPECPLPRLHAVSAFGTRLGFFKVDQNQSIQPSFAVTHPGGTLATDLALKKCWDCDIRKDEGEKRLKTIAREIKRACAAL